MPKRNAAKCQVLHVHVKYTRMREEIKCLRYLVSISDPEYSLQMFEMIVMLNNTLNNRRRSFNDVHSINTGRLIHSSFAMQRSLHCDSSTREVAPVKKSIKPHPRVTFPQLRARARVNVPLYENTAFYASDQPVHRSATSSIIAYTRTVILLFHQSPQNHEFRVLELEIPRERSTPFKIAPLRPSGSDRVQRCGSSLQSRNGLSSRWALRPQVCRNSVPKR